MAKQNPNNRKYKSGSFAGIPRIVMTTKSYRGLSTKAKALLIEMAFMLNKNNNGDISVSFAVMKKFGWKRNATIHKAVKELQEARLVMKTRDGAFRYPKSVCALYAVTWRGIDECKGKNLDVSPTNAPPRKFSAEKE